MNGVLPLEHGEQDALPVIPQDALRDDQQCEIDGCVMTLKV